MTKIPSDLWPGIWVCQRRWESPLCWGAGTCWWFDAESAAPHPDTRGPMDGGSPVCLEKKQTHMLLSESSCLYKTDKHSDCRALQLHLWITEISIVHCLCYISVGGYFCKSFFFSEYYEWIDQKQDMKKLEVVCWQVMATGYIREYLDQSLKANFYLFFLFLLIS